MIKARGLSFARMVAIAPAMLLLLPRLVISTGHQYAIFGAILLCIFINDIRSLTLSRSNALSLICTFVCVWLVAVGGMGRDDGVDGGLFLFAATLVLFSLHRRNEDLKSGFYWFGVVSVVIAIPMSFFGNPSFLVPASTYEVFGVERISFFFTEPSHYSIFLALSFGIGLVTQRARWSQVLLLVGVVMTFSLSGLLLVSWVYFANHGPGRQVLWALLTRGGLIVLGLAVLLPVLMQFDSSGVVSARVNEVLTGFNVGFSYGSSGVRFASASAGIVFLGEALINSDITQVFFGLGLNGIENFLHDYYYRYFLADVENSSIFNFLNAALITLGLVGFFFYLGALDNVRRALAIGFWKWCFLLVALSMTNGYMYGPLAYVFLICAAYSVAAVPASRATSELSQVDPRFKQAL